MCILQKHPKLQQGTIMACNGVVTVPINKKTNLKLESPVGPKIFNSPTPQSSNPFVPPPSPIDTKNMKMWI